VDTVKDRSNEFTPPFKTDVILRMRR